MKITKKTPVLFLLTLTVFLSACTKDSSTPVNRSDFLGSWSVSEYSTKLAYEVTISADPNSANGVFISGFANTLPSGPPAGATIDGSKITLDANQVLDGLKINGGGVLSAKIINWKYTIDDGANLSNVVSTYTKK